MNRRESTVRRRPWLEDLVRGFVEIVLGDILSRILLCESPFEAFERIGVEKIVGVGWFVKRVMRHCLVRGGGWR